MGLFDHLKGHSPKHEAEVLEAEAKKVVDKIEKKQEPDQKPDTSKSSGSK